MTQNTIDQILENLGSTIKTMAEKQPPEINYQEVVKNIPHRSLSADHLHGGTARNFSSTGIKDTASKKTLTVTDNGIESTNAKIDQLLGSVTVENKLTAESAVITQDLTVSGILRANVEVNYNNIIKQIPNRALSGDLINGGTIRNFASSGIKDSASKIKLMITDEKVSLDDLEVKNIKNSVNVEQTLTAENVNVTGVLTATRIEVKELKADLRLERTTPLEFKAAADNPIYGKGLIWTGAGGTKQFILSDPDAFFSTEHIDLLSGKSYMIDRVKVLDLKELGNTVVKSNLKEVGNLKKLTVLGDVNFNNYLFYNSTIDRLGFGTEQPNATFSISDNNVELMLGIKDKNSAEIGTYGYQDVNIVTDNTSRITVSNNGNILLGNKNSPPTQVSIHGKLSIGINQPDPTVDLHVNGSVRFNNKLQTHSDNYPTVGSFNVGDIVWNTEPKIGKPIGWVCVRTGTPGDWSPFGIIG
jgi:hypothetical protein